VLATLVLSVQNGKVFCAGNHGGLNWTETYYRTEVQFSSLFWGQCVSWPNLVKPTVKRTSVC